MSKTDHERGLSELLGEIARADQAIEPPREIEERVMRAVRLNAVRPNQKTAGVAPYAIAGVIAAGLFIAILLPRAPEPTPAPIDTSGRAAVAAQPGAAPESTAAASAPARAVRKTARKAARPSPSAREILNFVPLSPMDVQELSGSFQVVRVQLPRAAFGGLGLDPVQADVLLGEDGLARAIRFTTDTIDGHPRRFQ